MGSIFPGIQISKHLVKWKQSLGEGKSNPLPMMFFWFSPPLGRWVAGYLLKIRGLDGWQHQVTWRHRGKWWLVELSLVGKCLQDHPSYRKWLITTVIVSPLTGVFPLSNGLNGLKMGVTNYLLTGMILQVGGGMLAIGWFPKGWSFTLPETNIAPENGWLEDKPFLFGMAYF